MNVEPKNAKFQLIVKTAGELFMLHGIKRITVEEICHTAGVSKMTFYKYFHNKIDAAKFFINRRISEALTEYNNFMSADILFSDKVKKIIKLKFEKTEEFGPEFFGELIDNTIPEIAELFDRLKNENFKIFLNHLVKAQKKGDIRINIKPAFILYMLYNMIEIANDEKLLKMYGSPKDLIAELTNFFFYGILPREQKNDQ